MLLGEQFWKSVTLWTPQAASAASSSWNSMYPKPFFLPLSSHLKIKVIFRTENPIWFSPVLSDFSNWAKVHEEWVKILIRDVIVETIRTLLSSGLLTFRWSNEHPAGKGFGQPKRQKIADANLFLVGPWPGALLLVPPVLPLAAPPSTPTFLISTYKWLYEKNPRIVNSAEWYCTCFPSTQWGPELKQFSRVDTELKVANLEFLG